MKQEYGKRKDSAMSISRRDGIVFDKDRVPYLT